MTTHESVVPGVGHHERVPDRSTATPAGVLAMVFWAAASLVWAVMAMTDRAADIGLYGALCATIVTAPLCRRGYDWLSPWSLVVLGVYIGSGWRCAAIFGAGLGDSVVQKYYLLGRDIGTYGRPFVVLALGLVLLTTGYILAEQRQGLPAVASVRSPRRGGSRFWWVVGACALVGLFAFWRYAQATGGLNTQYISAKRTSYQVGGSSYQGAQGQWRLLNEFASIAFWMAVAKLSQTGRRFKPTERVIVALLFANAALLPFYSSVRSQIIYIALTGLAVYAGMRGRLPARLVTSVGAGALGILAVTTMLRRQSEKGTLILSPEEAIRSISDAMVMNLNFTDVSKAVNIIAAVPERLPYSQGSTIANYALAWVPRSVWPEKPIIDAGVSVGVQVYGTDGSAIPPGAVAELYWAFGLGGVLIGSLVLGLFLGWAGSQRRRWPTMGWGIVYSAAVLDVGVNLMSGSIGYGLSSAVLSAAMCIGVLKVAGERIRHTVA